MKRPFYLLLIGLGSILLVVGAGIYRFNTLVLNPGTMPLPAEIGDQTLFLQQGGLHAKDEFFRLHRKDFPLISGSVGMYGSKHKVQLWVGETILDFMAERMVADMRDKIAEGSSPFSPTGVRQVSDHEIYTLDGLGQKHFYYHTVKTIIWIAVDDDIAEKALLEILEFYP